LDTHTTYAEILRECIDLDNFIMNDEQLVLTPLECEILEREYGNE